jgi:hypothetical protein
MQCKHWLVVVSILVFGAVGCRELNREAYCPDHPDDLDCKRAPDRCGDIMCAAPTPVCETGTTTCVQCVEDKDCLSAYCTAQHTCIECRMDDDCPSKLCLADNKCAGIDEVTYVGGDNSTDNPMCSLGSPCQNLDQAVKATALGRYIKLAGAIVNAGATTFDNKNVTIYGRLGAQISRSSPGEVLIIKGIGSPEVNLIDLEIVGNVSSGGKNCVEIADTAIVTMARVDVHNHGQAGVSLDGTTSKLVMNESKVRNNTLDGLQVANGTLEVNHSWILNNGGTAGVSVTNATKTTIDSTVIADNSGTNGGVYILAGPCVIRNSIISRNGGAGSNFGGMALSSTSVIFEFNTVANNVAKAAGISGISCAAPTVLANSILTSNAIGATCAPDYSLTALTGTPSGTNKTGDPSFLDVDGDPTGPMFFRIGSASAAKDSANPAATLDVDIDGQARSDARKDMGADEFK